MSNSSILVLKQKIKVKGISCIVYHVDFLSTRSKDINIITFFNQKNNFLHQILIGTKVIADLYKKVVCIKLKYIE